MATATPTELREHVRGETIAPDEPLYDEARTVYNAMIDRRPHVIVRAIGPSLAAAGVQGAVQDTTLELHDGQGNVVAMNDNWKESQEAEITATGIPPNNDLESAIVATLASGNYTAIVRGVNNTTGVALVEIYALQ